MGGIIGRRCRSAQVAGRDPGRQGMQFDDQQSELLQVGRPSLQMHEEVVLHFVVPDVATPESVGPGGKRSGVRAF